MGLYAHCHRAQALRTEWDHKQTGPDLLAWPTEATNHRLSKHTSESGSKRGTEVGSQHSWSVPGGHLGLSGPPPGIAASGEQTVKVAGRQSSPSEPLPHRS